MVEIADRCNEACVHCYQVQGQKGELSTAEWLRIFDELHALGVMFLTISGGEPTLRKDFLELVRYARQLRFAVKVYSNALNIDESMARELGRLAVQEVQISLYSQRAEVHDRVTRVPGSFEQVVSAVKHLRASGVKVLLKSPLMKLNAAEYSEYVHFVTSLGADYALDPNLSPREDGDLGPTQFRIGKQEYLAVKRDPRFARRREPQRPDGAREGSRKPCGACNGNVHIEANGEMRPCTQWNVPTGQALKGVQDAWHNDTDAAAIRALTWDALPGCRVCDLQRYCQRCFADSERYTGDALAPYAKACRGARWQYELSTGTEPEIDSRAGHCPTDPVGPFQNAGEHRFLIDEISWHAAPATSAAPSHTRPVQLVQIRRHKSAPLTPISAPPSDH